MTMDIIVYASIIFNYKQHYELNFAQHDNGYHCLKLHYKQLQPEPTTAEDGSIYRILQIRASISGHIFASVFSRKSSKYILRFFHKASAKFLSFSPSLFLFFWTLGTSRYPPIIFSN